MARSIEEFSERDIQRIDSEFNFFYCLETEGMCCTWHTDYYYTRFADGRYGFASLDPTDEELCDYEEFESAKQFAKHMKSITRSQEFEPWEWPNWDIRSLFPEDLRKYDHWISSHFNDVTAALISEAVRKNDTELVNALLPDFAKFRKTLDTK